MQSAGSITAAVISVLVVVGVLVIPLGSVVKTDQGARLKMNDDSLGGVGLVRSPPIPDVLVALLLHLCLLRWRADTRTRILLWVY